MTMGVAYLMTEETYMSDRCVVPNHPLQPTMDDPNVSQQNFYHPVMSSALYCPKLPH